MDRTTGLPCRSMSKRDREDIICCSSEDDYYDDEGIFHHRNHNIVKRQRQLRFFRHYPISTLNLPDEEFKKPARIICKTEDAVELMDRFLGYIWKKKDFHKKQNFFRDLFALCAMVHDSDRFKYFLKSNDIDINKNPGLNGTTFLEGFSSSDWTWVDRKAFDEDPDAAVKETGIVLNPEKSVCPIDFDLHSLFWNKTFVSELRKIDREQNGIIQTLFSLYNRGAIKFVEFSLYIDMKDDDKYYPFSEDRKKIAKYLEKPHVCEFASYEIYERADSEEDEDEDEDQ